MTDIKKYEPLWGSWYIDSMIGEGSFGKVYKVRKEEFGVTYYSAVKIISIPQSEAELRQARSEGMDAASARSYFHTFVTDIIQEVELMSAFRGNSNIVSFEDHKVIEHEDDIGWDILIRMELLSSLSEKVTEAPLTKDEVIKLGIHICRALELCAIKHTIHRDIKPDNIFVSQYGEYKLGDFGIARQIERTMLGLSKKGTYTYMAPEVFNGSEYGASVDMYSLGVVMYRFLNRNRTPFLPDFPNPPNHRNKEEAMARRMKGEAIPPINEIGTELNDIVLKACAFDRSDRFTSASEMREALERCAGVHGYAPEVPEASRKENVYAPEPREQTFTALREFTQMVLPSRPKDEGPPDDTPKEEPAADIPQCIINRLAAFSGVFFGLLAALCLSDRVDRNVFVFLPVFVFCVVMCASRFRYNFLNAVFLLSLFVYLSMSFLWTFRMFDYHLLILAWTLAVLAAAAFGKSAWGVAICAALSALSVFVCVRVFWAMNGIYLGERNNLVAGSAAMPILVLSLTTAGIVLVLKKNTQAEKHAAAYLVAAQFFPIASLLAIVVPSWSDTAHHIANADFIGITPEFFAWWEVFRLASPVLEMLAYAPFFALAAARMSPGLFNQFLKRENQKDTLVATTIFFIIITVAIKAVAMYVDRIL